MRHEDLRRPRGIESLWLRLRLAASILFPPRPCSGADPLHLSDHLLRDVGLERARDAREVAFRPHWADDGRGRPARGRRGS
jgi:hypothetical protein